MGMDLKLKSVDVRIKVREILKADVLVCALRTHIVALSLFLADAQHPRALIKVKYLQIVIYILD